MSPAELIDAIKANGGVLAVDGDEIVYQLPKDDGLSARRATRAKVRSDGHRESTRRTDRQLPALPALCRVCTLP